MLTGCEKWGPGCERGNCYFNADSQAKCAKPNKKGLLDKPIFRLSGVEMDCNSIKLHSLGGKYERIYMNNVWIGKRRADPAKNTRKGILH